MTTLTKQALLDKAKPRYEEVEVAGVGTIGIRSISEFRQSQRDAKLYGQDGKITDEGLSRARAYELIDQLMADQKNPMFTEADLESILEMDAGVTRPLYQAVKDFNNPAKKNGSVSNVGKQN